MALDNPASPRLASISSTSAASDWPRSAAASLSASQNGASSDIDVLCPAMVKERFSGRTDADFAGCITTRGTPS
jgi:hypothetical protein